MSALTMATERVRVTSNPARIGPAPEGFKWVVYCGACDAAGGGIDGLFWGKCLGGTNDHALAVRYAAVHAEQHKPCGECGRIKPVPEVAP